MPPSQWKREMFRHRNDDRCSCTPAIPGVLPDRIDPACPVHGWVGDPDAEDGRSIVENDAIQAEHRG